MAAHRKPDELTGGASFDQYARRWFLFGVVLLAISIIVAAGVVDRHPLVWILGFPWAVGCMAFGAYLHRVGQRGGWARTEE